MVVRGLERGDLAYIISVVDRWWGGPSGQRIHPFFFHEFGSDGLTAVIDEKIVGFLLGFIIDRNVGYVHLVGIAPDQRRTGIGKALYTAFEKRASLRDAKSLKAISAIGNETSKNFHEALGFHHSVDNDYAGPGRARQIFKKSLIS